jgi:twitching motility protein PilT
MAILQQFIQVLLEKKGSDLHITSGSPPQMRIDGSLVPMNFPSLTPADTKQLVYSILNDTQKHHFEEEKELDFSFSLQGASRFRVNVFIQRGCVAAAIRVIPLEIQSFERLGLPKIIKDLCEKPRGLVLVTGQTGSGKSTTLAAMVDNINSETRSHIITIEDPIEYLHAHKKSLINQREVETDTKSFQSALKHILRQDPDVVLIGEMRDKETIEAALTIAETGHLTFATLHTNSCVQTIHRIIDVFPPGQQSQVRAQLSFILEGVISQQLLEKKGGGRCLALEILIPNSAIRNLIREDKVHQIYSSMQTGQEKNGMQTLNQSLFELVIRKYISREQALQQSNNSEELEGLFNRGETTHSAPHFNDKPRLP